MRGMRGLMAAGLASFGRLDAVNQSGPKLVLAIPTAQENNFGPKIQSKRLFMLLSRPCIAPRTRSGTKLPPSTSLTCFGANRVSTRTLATVPNPEPPLKLLAFPSRFLFFTGKGGVGKTSLACAVSLELVSKGLKVLLVSTDPASNLDEMLGTKLSHVPTPVKGVAGLSAMNIDPEAAAEGYRLRVLSQMPSTSTATEKAEVREQLSGACTTEIAAFDEFAGLLAGDYTSSNYDHIVFDTAPTGHTLRLLSLPGLWAGFLLGNDRGASCLGPHSGLKMQEARFRRAVEALGDTEKTRIVVVSRPEVGALKEAARTHGELDSIGLGNQWLVLNGVFRPMAGRDGVADAVARGQERAIEGMADGIKGLERDEVPLRTWDMVGVPALKALLHPDLAPPQPESPQSDGAIPESMQPLHALIEEFGSNPKGLIMVLGKGGVGKTTVASALAVSLASRGIPVHLSTTDPAAHLSFTLGSDPIPNLTVDRIDPKLETQRYISKILATKGKGLDGPALALLEEDLQSPCTEEVAVFHAFSRTVASARSELVILDTAPTGHTLLLMDAAGAYHRQVARELAPGVALSSVSTPLTRLKDPKYTRVLLVALPEQTPVSEAAALQADLERAGIKPYAWIANRCLTGSGTKDPVLKMRMGGERRQLDRIAGMGRGFVVPWTDGVVGVEALRVLAG